MNEQTEQLIASIQDAPVTHGDKKTSPDGMSVEQSKILTRILDENSFRHKHHGKPAYK